jgi:SAM-dependent methyltransferase
MYGYKEAHAREGKSYEYMKAISELHRVLRPGGKLLLTFPFGKFEHHGFFQQVDKEMIDRIIEMLSNSGSVEVDYLKYEKNGWRFALQQELHHVQSYNPHTGDGKLNDGAAHSRSIACIQYIKRN